MSYEVHHSVNRGLYMMYIKSSCSDKDAYRYIYLLHIIEFYILYITLYIILLLIWHINYW